MKKFTTKTLLALACVAVAGIQSVGAFSGDVLSGASIQNHSAGLTSVVGNGTKNATLHFNADTRIDWAKLNVAKDEVLNFKNGNFAVLNNVVGKSITKVAGKINGENGKIIISNPNGILFQGGKFESAGALVLTTKDLTSYQADQIAGLTADAIKELANNENFNVIALVDGGSIKAGGDINIIANGVEAFNGEIFTDKGDILVTADGANFVKGTTSNKVVMKADDGTSTTVAFGALTEESRPNGKAYANTVFAGSTVKTENGDIKIVSGDSIFTLNGGEMSAKNIDLKAETGNVYVNTSGSNKMVMNGDVNAEAAIRTYLKNTEVNGDTTMKGTRVSGHLDVFNGNVSITDTKKDMANFNKNNVVYLLDCEINGDKFNINSDKTPSQVDSVYLDGIKAPNTDFDITAHTLDFDNVQAANTNVKTAGYSIFGTNSVVNGDLSVTNDHVPDGGKVLFGRYDMIIQEDGTDTRGHLREGETFTVKGNMNIDSGSTVGIAGKVDVGGKADISTQYSSVVYATSNNDNIDCSITAKDGLTINAPASLNELLPLDGEMSVDVTLEYGSENGKVVRGSRFYEEMQRDYVQHRIPEPNPDPDPDPDPVIPDIPDDDVSKIINNLVLNGVDTVTAQSFTPIAFAADEDQDVVKRIAKIVFKTPENIVSISDRLIQKDINGSF